MQNFSPSELSGETQSRVPGKTTPANPLIRLGFFVVFLLTLPFTWGQSSSCNGPIKTYTGVEHLVLRPDAAEKVQFAVIFVGPIVLGFVQYFVRPLWARVGAEFLATMLSGFGTFVCLLSGIFSGDLLHKSRDTFIAPFVAAVAIFGILIHAFKSTIQRMNELIIERRTARSRNRTV